VINPGGCPEVGCGMKKAEYCAWTRDGASARAPSTTAEDSKVLWLKRPSPAGARVARLDDEPMRIMVLSLHRPPVSRSLMPPRVGTGNDANASAMLERR